MRTACCITCCVICLLLAGQSHAGAWPREPGATFLSFSTEVDTGDMTDTFTTLFVEYGLTDRLTLGLDAGLDDGTLYKGIVFARMPLNRPEADMKLAIEMGVGLTDDAAVLRPGLMIGRGLDWGWMAMDTLATVDIEAKDVDLTTDLTLGVNMSARSKLILQLQSGHQVMDLEYLKFASSVVYEYKPGRHLELGALAGIKNLDGYAVKLGLWRHF
mgnify:CR=1 FL=1